MEQVCFGQPPFDGISKSIYELSVEWNFEGNGMRTILVYISLALAACLWPGLVAAQQSQACTCTPLPNADEEGVGQILRTSGRVSYAGPRRTRAAAPGTVMRLGVDYIVGPAGSLGVAVGQSCTASVGPSSIVTVSELTNGNLCLRVAELEPSIGELRDVSRLTKSQRDLIGFLSTTSFIIGGALLTMSW